MNKLFTKIVGAALGLTMAIGVGVAVSANNGEAVPVHAAVPSGNELLFTINFKDNGTDSSTALDASKFYSNGVTSVTDKNGSTVTSTFSTAGINGNPTKVFPGTGGLKCGSNGNAASFTLNIPSAYQAKFTYAVVNCKNATRSITLTAGGGSDSVASGNSSFDSHDLSIGSSSTATTLAVSIASASKNAAYIASIAVYKASASSKTLSSISVSGCTTEFTVGDAFSFGGTVTATYSDSSTADVTSSASFSGYNMSTTGSQTVTVSYTEGGTTKTATYTITVNDPRTVTGLTVFDEDLNKLADEDEITLTASSGSSISTDVMCVVTYSPSGSDGNVSITSASGAGFSVTTDDNELYTLTFSANGNHVITFEASEDDSFAITVTYIVSGLPNVTTVTDTINNALTGVGTGTSYADWSGKTDQSNAVYAGRSAGDKSTVQLRTSGSNEGVVTTQSSGGVATLITLTFNNNTTNSRRVDVYGKNTPYSAASDLFNASNQGTLIGYATYDKNGTGETVYTIDVSSDKTKQFSYIGIRSNSSALYLDSIKITWSIEQEIIDVLEYIYIDGSLTTTSYTEGQTISLSGLTVYGHYTTAGDVSLMGKTGLTFGCSPTTATSTSLDEITVNASYEGKNASETYEISVVADYVTSISWTGTTAAHFKAFSGSQLTAAQVGSWSVVPTFAGAGQGSALSFGQYTLKVGSKTISSLPYTWASEDDGQELSITYGKDENGDDFVKKNNNAVGNICATINAIDHSETISGLINKSTGWTTEQSSALSDQDFGTRDLDANISMTGVKSSGSTNVRIYSETLRTYAGNEMYFTPSNGAIIKTINLANISATGCSDSEATHSGNVWTIKNGTETITFTGLNKVTVNNDIVVEYTIEGSETTTVHYANDMDHFDAQKKVVEFAKFMNTTMNGTNVCSGTFANLESAWDDVAGKYDELFGASTTLNETELAWAKNMLKYATAAWGSDAEAACVEKAMKTYEHCVSTYGLEAFMSPVRSVTSAKVSPLVNIIGENTNTVAIIVIISMISVTAIGGYFFLRKRKEN